MAARKAPASTAQLLKAVLTAAATLAEAARALAANAGRKPPRRLARPALLLDDKARRVTVGEVCAMLGYGIGWFNRRIRAGDVPAPRHDVGARRRWYTADEAASIVASLNASAQRKPEPLSRAARAALAKYQARPKRKPGKRARKRAK